MRLLATPRARALIAAALVAIGALAAVLPLQDDAARSVPVAETGAEFERLGDLTLGEQAKVLEEGSDARALNAEIATSTLPLEAVRPFKAIALGSDNYANALNCLTQAIYYEAATEPVSGQRAVAQVVLNRVRHPAYPNSVCGVVYEGSSKPVCQFSFTCDGSLARQPEKAWWDRAAKVARAALAGAVYKPVGLATHYHTLAVHPYWAGSLQSVGTIGAHRFYRWRGAAGQPAAFHERYGGGEPLPAPNPHAVLTSSSPADPVALARAYEAAYSSAQAQAQSAAQVPEQPGAAKIASAAGIGSPALAPARFQPPQAVSGALPQSGGVKPEYARSGQWLKQP